MKPYPLILLHHAGGSAAFFAPLAKALPPEIQPIALDLPGRGRRWREAAVTSIDEATDSLLDAVSAVNGPFAVFGHSLGAYVGLALAARLEETTGISRCSTLFASANAGPGGAVLPFEGSPLLVSDEDIFEITNKSGGGLSQEVLDHPQLRRRSAGLLRADFAVSQSFLSKQRRTVTEADIVVCWGRDDIFTPRQLDQWRLNSTQPTESHGFPGDHFYLEQNVPELVDLITRRLLVPAAQRG
ncbi:thioesterase II family protein [Streptomyces sp. UNOB3_S3]|uniref:thioesterase II family protein n=1 Tax=Streptomyces sp. UNOB3_S3 TaxID=2871682 RepID=UPI001E3B1BA1|nr:alpha/beta fold hydrolase [Streptomyces sp. UNOB3_S3]MCC3776855.1 alpha/beta fold hydrolase [Streptomyces sp. UNOB3_S3]